MIIRRIMSNPSNEQTIMNLNMRFGFARVFMQGRP